MNDSVRPIYASRDGLVRQLERAGYAIHTFSVSSVGPYAIQDADWNYKDVPHLNIVHTKVRAILGTVEDDVITTLNLQKIFGIAVPLTLVNYATSETSQTYFTTLGPYVLVVYTSYRDISTRETEVTTSYTIAAAGLARFAFPLLEKILRGNYKTLMLEDLPMRDRRGQLRARGFHFKSDGRPRTFIETTNVAIANVVAPHRALTAEHSVSRAKLARDESLLIGPNDDRGVRLILRDDSVLVFPRFCDHEGAALDCAPVLNCALKCPWHAKAVAPLATVLLRAGESVSFEIGTIRISKETIDITLPRESDSSVVANAATSA